MEDRDKTIGFFAFSGVVTGMMMETCNTVSASFGDGQMEHSNL
jgi:hypothetical protein